MMENNSALSGYFVYFCSISIVVGIEVVTLPFFFSLSPAFLFIPKAVHSRYILLHV